MGKNTPQFGNFERLGYGAGELGPAMAGSTIIFFQLVFLTDVAGMTTGRFVNVWGAIGVRISASCVGWTIGPPAARL